MCVCVVCVCLSETVHVSERERVSVRESRPAAPLPPFTEMCSGSEAGS